MKPSQVLREAALRIRNNKSAAGCQAIERVVEKLDMKSYSIEQALIKETIAYLHQFAPKRRTVNSFWFGSPFEDLTIHGLPKARCQQQRLTAMCFAAAVAEAEGN